MAEEYKVLRHLGELNELDKIHWRAIKAVLGLKWERVGLIGLL